MFLTCARQTRANDVENMRSKNAQCNSMETPQENTSLCILK